MFSFKVVKIKTTVKRFESNVAIANAHTLKVLNNIPVLTICMIQIIITTITFEIGHHGTVAISVCELWISAHTHFHSKYRK